VRVGFECSDGLSGVGICPADIVYSAEGVNFSTAAHALTGPETTAELLLVV